VAGRAVKEDVGQPDERELDEGDRQHRDAEDLLGGNHQPGVERRVGDVVTPGKTLGENELLGVVAAGAGEQQPAHQEEDEDVAGNEGVESAPR